MQLCEDSLSFKNFRSWYRIQAANKINKTTMQGQNNSCEEAKTQARPILTDSC